MAGRAAAEALMVDEAEVSVRTGRTVQDEATGRETPEYEVLFVSPCKVQARSLTATESEAGGRQVTTVRLEVHFPVSAPPVKPDDLVRITAARYDSSLVDRRLRVVAPAGKSFGTARRVDVMEDVT